MEGGKSHGSAPYYVIGAALILAAVLVSASVYISFSSLSSSLANMRIDASAAGSQAAAAPSPQLAAPPLVPAPSQQAPVQQGPANIKLEGLPFRGPAEAKVIIVEYSDFQCPFCKRAFPTVQQIMQEYDGKVKFYYKHFPLSFHQNAQKSAEAYECALLQGKQWEYHDKLFENSQADGTGLNTADLKQYAAGLGLDTAKFNSCLDTGQAAAKVQADTAEGSQNGVGGTPTFFINGESLVGAQPYSSFKALIDSKLAG